MQNRDPQRNHAGGEQQHDHAARPAGRRDPIQERPRRVAVSEVLSQPQQREQD